LYHLAQAPGWLEACPQSTGDSLPDLGRQQFQLNLPVYGKGDSRTPSVHGPFQPPLAERGEAPNLMAQTRALAHEPTKELPRVLVLDCEWKLFPPFWLMLIEPCHRIVDALGQSVEMVQHAGQQLADQVEDLRLAETGR
jgi:hypothetical protein